MEIGKSLFDENGAKIVNEIWETAKQRGVTIHLPTDFKVASKFAADAEVRFEQLSILTLLSPRLSPNKKVYLRVGWAWTLVLRPERPSPTSSDDARPLFGTGKY